MRIFLVLVACFHFLAFSESANSQNSDVKGQTDPQYSQAVDEWLAGKDVLALNRLAALSRDGNPAAQILLASIASRANMHVHVTADLPRKERIALLRKPKGLSGKSWLLEAEEKEPLATALLQSARLGKKAAAIVALFELGETETALLAAKSVNSPDEAFELLKALVAIESQLPIEASRVFGHLMYQAASDGNGRYLGSARVPRRFSDSEKLTVSDLEWGVMPGPQQLLDDNNRLDEIKGLSGKVKSWTPMRQFCQEKCPSAPEECLITGAFWLVRTGPFSVRSPVQSLIPNDVYWSSARLEGDLARSVLELERFSKVVKNSSSERLSACFVDVMKASQAIHGYGNF